MITISIIVLAIILAAGVFLTYKRKDEDDFRHVGIAVGIVILGLIIAFVQPFAVERVDAGHVGIKVNLTGNERGVSRFEYKTGWVIYNTWISRLYEFPTFQQHVDYPEQTVITKGGFQTTIKPAFNYSLKAGDIGDMFQNLRLDIGQIEQKWLLNAVVSTVNDVANLWTIDEIFNERAKFEAAIIIEANKRISKWFNISQLRTNIVPPEALRQSIEAKTKAVQEVQVAENQRLVAIAEGDKKIAEARADSAQRVIRAAGEAEEMRRKQVVLTNAYIDFLKVQKWNGVNSQVVSGSGGGVLVNIGEKN